MHTNTSTHPDPAMNPGLLVSGLFNRSFGPGQVKPAGRVLTRSMTAGAAGCLVVAGGGCGGR